MERVLRPMIEKRLQFSFITIQYGCNGIGRLAKQFLLKSRPSNTVSDLAATKRTCDCIYVFVGSGKGIESSQTRVGVLIVQKLRGVKGRKRKK